MERETALSWSLRRHYLGEGIQRHIAPGMPKSTLTTNALCDPNQTLYTLDELRRHDFAEDLLAKDHPMCKRCTRLALKADAANPKEN